jgi:UDP-N-acetylmuramoylalanine--D-glutamate ligase
MTMALSSLPSSFLSSLKHPLAVVGLGVTGRSILQLLQRFDSIPDSSILTFDEKDSSAQFHSSAELMKKTPATLIVSPGVPLNLPWIQAAQAGGARITSELEIAFSFLTTEQVIGVTGSIGKSTTTSLLGAAVKKISNDSFVGGNLGFPLADYVCGLFAGKARGPWVVLELSSYQLENFSNLRCDWSVLTFLTPNHMERYPSLDEYYRFKLSLLQKTNRLAVLNARGGDLSRLQPALEKAAPCPLLWADRSSPVLKQHLLLPSRMIGTYNLDNLAMAGSVGDAAGWPEEAFEAMRDFSGLPHRLENLGVYKGVRFINDSKATTIESVIQAIETVLENIANEATLWVLLGGHDKGLPWANLKNSKANSAHVHPIFFGEFGTRAKSLTGLSGTVFPTLALALQDLPKMVKAGDVVLLSPGGTSHDEFKNFEERGDFFLKQIKSET